MMMEKYSESSMELREMPLRRYMCIVTGGMPCRSQSGCSRNISSNIFSNSFPWALESRVRGRWVLNMLVNWTEAIIVHSVVCHVS